MFSSTMKASVGFAGLMASLAAAGFNDVVRRASDPTDYSWIKKWAAVGDSFTAGIGSGDLYSDTDNSYECSRYDYTYPVIMNNVFGPSIDSFDYLACSGAKSTGIYDQINSLDDDMDLVVLTAGGNDLCLVSSTHVKHLAELLTLFPKVKYHRQLHRGSYTNNERM